MELENIDYISKQTNPSERINLNNLTYYHGKILPPNFSRDKFLEIIPAQIPSCIYGSIQHHLPFGGIHPRFGKYAIVLKDKTIQVFSDSDLGGQHLVDLLYTLAEKS